MNSSLKTPTRLEGALLWLVSACALGASFMMTSDRPTWVLEVFWVLFALPVLALLWRRLPLTRLLCWLLFIHSLVLIYGGTYTYAEAPLGYWLKDAFDLARNPWDRVGHFMQGFEPAILMRELLLRFSPLRKGGLLVFVILSICLSFSAFYEILEWWAAVVLGQSAEAFLGLQGDVWDAQWDMFLCLCGAVAALLTLSWVHDRQLRLSRF